MTLPKLIEERQNALLSVIFAEPHIQAKLKRHLENSMALAYEEAKQETIKTQREMFARHIDEMMKVTTNPHELVDLLAFYRNTYAILNTNIIHAELLLDIRELLKRQK